MDEVWCRAMLTVDLYIILVVFDHTYSSTSSDWGYSSFMKYKVGKVSEERRVG